MSLVNNMLRDLDQRRKESDGSGGAIKLMPARDFVSDDRKGLVQIVLIGLVLIAAALVYYWFTLNQNNTEQQLGIQVGTQQPSSVPADPQQLIQDLEASILSSEEALELAQESIELALSVPVVTIESSPEVPNVVTTVVSPEVYSPAEVVDVPSSSLPIAASPEPEIGRVTAGPELIRSGPVESVKEAPRFSNEQLDTIAVQGALRQISNGETEAAYDTLAQFIVSNRYAHQSRETFAKLLMSQGQVHDANALIDSGLELAPNHSGFKKVKARLLMADGKRSEAVSILISRAPSVSSDPEYHDLLASAQLSSRDFSGAMISYRGLVQFDETQGKWWYGFASAHDQLGNSQPARQAYSQAMQYSNLSANLRRRSQERLSALIP